MLEAARRETGTKVAFGDVVQLSKARSRDPAADGYDRYVGLEHLDPGVLKIRSWGDIADGTTFTNVFNPGQVLFGKRRAYQRKVAVADFSGVCSGDIYVLEPRGDDLLRDLLPFICQTDAFFDHAVGTSAGSLSPRTNWKSLAGFEFHLPPLEEQRHILEVLNASRRVCDTYSISTERLLEVRRSAQSRLLFPSALSDDASHYRLEDIAEINPTDQPLDESAPFFPMDALDEWEREISSSETRGTRGGIRAQSGDVLMARITPCLENGKIAQVPMNIARCGGSTEFIVFRAQKWVSNTYLYWLITSDRFRNVAIAMMSGTTGRQRVSGSDLKKILIPKMDPADMEKLATMINSIERHRKEGLRRATEFKTIHAHLLNHLIGGQSE
jgi:type I restriction enzyme, S subunit